MPRSFRRIFAQKRFRRNVLRKGFGQVSRFGTTFRIWACLGSGADWLRAGGCGLGRIFSQNICAEYFRRSVFAEMFSAGFSFLEPHLEFGPAWGLGLTGWGLGAVAWGLGLRAEEVSYFINVTDVGSKPLNPKPFSRCHFL